MTLSRIAAVATLLLSAYGTTCATTTYEADGTKVQHTPDEVLATAQKVNAYFMKTYEDPTVPTNVKRLRPSNLWTRAVYYEGLMALIAVDKQETYIDYARKWADFHKWMPRNGVTTCDADDQCCGQTYIELLPYIDGDSKNLTQHIKDNLDHQMRTPNDKVKALYGWWTWIDAIQMAMPLYMQMSRLTGDSRYSQHAMNMYRWSRDTLAGGLMNKENGLWWRDADYVRPYKEPDGKDCYWSRGNGWVYAALVRCMDLLPEKSKPYKELKRDYLRMTAGIIACQRPDGFWNPSLVSDNYAMPETSGTALFLYGICWGMNRGYLKAKDYAPIAQKAWQAIAHDAIHPNGFIGWMQGTGKDPSAGQPFNYSTTPDFEDYGTGCVLLGAVEYYKWLKSQK